jgi:hypothetical protein
VEAARVSAQTEVYDVRAAAEQQIRRVTEESEARLAEAHQAALAAETGPPPSSAPTMSTPPLNSYARR